MTRDGQKIAVPSWLGRGMGLGVTMLFLGLGLLRARPFVDDVTLAARGDDWFTYKRYADSILHGGLTLPAVTGPYLAPRGFLYNYFIAAIFRSFGENSTYVYVVQSAILGLSVWLMYECVRRLLLPVTGLAYLAVLAAYMYVDVFRYYSFKLLSENLLMLLLPIYFLLVMASVRRRSVAFSALAGVALGLCVLTRPNTIVVAAGGMLLYAIYSKRDTLPWSLLGTLVLTFVLTYSILLWRDYAVTGRLGIPVTLTSLAGQDSPGPFDMVRRALFCIGFTRAMGDADFQFVRPHWLVMWGLFGTYAYFVARKRYVWTFDEAILASFVPCYLLPLLAVALLNNYGFRMIIPVIPSTLFCGFRAGDFLRSSRGV